MGLKIPGSFGDVLNEAWKQGESFTFLIKIALGFYFIFVKELFFIDISLFALFLPQET